MLSQNLSSLGGSNSFMLTWYNSEANWIIQENGERAVLAAWGRKGVRQQKDQGLTFLR